MQQYLDLLTRILDHGVKKGDRTGTGTYSVFGHQMRFDLQDGFPLLTTKKVHLKSIIHELLWFLRGDTNIKYLNDNGVTIWDEWQGQNGELGPIYGNRWRTWGQPDSIIQPTPELRAGIDRTYLGVGNGQGSTGHPLGKTWEGMMSRCYRKTDIGYHTYGEKGVHVCNRWLEFSAFAEDAELLPGWGINKVLDKDGIGNGFTYGPTTCQWITPKENSLLKWKKVVELEEVSTGKVYRITNPTTFCEERGLPDGADKNLSDLWTGRKNSKVRYGYKLISQRRTDHVIDQISNVIDSLQHNPDSRRHIVTAWDPAWVEHMALPPCHLLFQFYVADGRLSCQLYQRSADVFLGVPFNIASYALLTMMMAQVTGLKPGEFVHTLGDAHLYLNHIDQATEQLLRKPRDLPVMSLRSDVGNLFEFKYEDFTLHGYHPHPAIKAPISI